MESILLFPLASTALGFVIALAWKSTVVLAVATIAARLLVRRSAALRHGVWTLAVATLLALPALQAMAPPLAAPLPFTRVLAQPVPRSVSAPAAGSAANTPAAPAPAPVTTPALRAEAAVPDAPVRDGLSRATALPWPAFVALAWLLGAVATFGFFALGRITLARFARSACPLDDAAWLTLGAEVGAQLGVRRPLRFLIADDATTPLTWGTLRPTILLPAAAAAWTPSQRRAFLVHELAHVARRDCAIQDAAHVACALYWFHPLAWFAAHRLRVEREQACDDVVIGDGASAPAYAQQLLAVVRAARTPRGALSLSGAAMAAPSQLESRVRALLDAGRDRRTVGRRHALAAGALAFAAVLPLAALAPAAPAAQASSATLSTLPLVALAPAAAPAPTATPEKEKSAVPGGTLQARWREALEMGRAEHAGHAYWIAYAIPFHAGHNGKETLLSDSEHWDSGDLEKHGPSLAERFKYEPADAVILFRVPARSSGGALAFDRIALRTARLSPALGGLPVISLGRIAPQESLEWLRKLLDEAPADRRAAVITTALSLHDTPQTLGMLVNLLDGRREDDVRIQAAEGMTRHSSERALEALVAHARSDRSEEVRREAAESVGDLDYAPATDALIALVKDVEPASVRAEAVESLGGREPDRVVPVLVSIAANDAEVNVRREAVETLGDLPGNAGLAALQKMARDPDPDVRSEAVETLNEMGLRAERAAKQGNAVE